MGNELEVIQGEVVDSSTALVTVQQLPADRDPVNTFIASKESKHSQRTMHRSLDTIAQLITGDPLATAYSLSWWELKPQHTKAIRARLIEQYKPASVNVMLSALRGILRECWELGYMSAEDFHRATNLKNTKDQSLPAGREISQGEILALLNTCNNDFSENGGLTPLGVRDAAIIAVLYTGGLRRAELVKLNLEDYDPETGKLFVQGKGRKERTTYLPESTRFYLNRWLERRNAVIGDDPAGALFTPIRKGGHIKANQLDAQTIYDTLKARADLAGVKDFSPHDFRRTLVGDLLDRGVDISTVASMVGHSNVNTTRRYDRRPDQAKKKAAELVTVPLPGKLV